MTKNNPKNGNKSDFLSLRLLTSFFAGRRVLKYFNDSLNWHLSVSLQKWTQGNINEIKQKMCKSDSIFLCLKSSSGKLFKWLLKMIPVPKEKRPLLNFFP